MISPGLHKIPIVSRSEFASEPLAKAPVIIMDGLSDWPALHRWSPQILGSIASNRTVSVAVSQSGVFRYHPGGSALDPKTQYVLENVPFKDVTAWIMQDNPQGPKYYVSHVNIGDQLPELLTDLRFPRSITSTRINLWFGSSGTVSPLHYDNSNNLFAQVSGVKQFTLFAPSETPNLYPFPEGSKFSHLSSVDVDNPDLYRFPFFKEAERIETTIYQGQLLFLPAFWWHHVRSKTISISVNQWWAPELSQCCAPNGVRTFRALYKRDPAAVQKALGLSSRGLVDSALALLASSPTIAILASAVAVDDWVRTGHGGKEHLFPDPVLRSRWNSLVAIASQECQSNDGALQIQDVKSCLEILRRHVDSEQQS